MGSEMEEDRATAKLIPPGKASSPAVAASMRGNRSKDTLPEISLRKALWRSGLRGYHKNVVILPGKPDVVYPRPQIAVFVHGCFWHRCPMCSLPMPKTNTEYWQAKFQRNQERDGRNMQALRDAGWAVVRLWECEVKKALDECVARVRQAIIEGRRHRAASEGANG